MKNILLIGSGGREHAISLKLIESKNVNKLYVIPGNPGISKIAECYDIDILDNSKLLDFAKEKNIDLVVVGPEGPLANGIVDFFQDHKIQIFGPNKQAAMFEASKSFSKNFMIRYNIPTGFFKEFINFKDAKNYIEEKGMPIVIKADGLAAGKGVLVAFNKEDAIDFARDCLENKLFGESSSKIIVEEFLDGEEGSYLLFLDSKSYIPMVHSQDHKQIFDGDKGPNTGGMGAYSPANVFKDNEEELREIVNNFLRGIEIENIDYKGVLYIGLIKTKDGLKVLEFNCRFGDPETQVILPRMKSDLIEIIECVINENLSKIKIEWAEESCACVVLSSKGYPGKYVAGKMITGLDRVTKSQVIHAGTKEKDGFLVTNGGRVLNVVATGSNLKEAIDKIYADISKIYFEGIYYRKDIGYKGLNNN